MNILVTITFIDKNNNDESFKTCISLEKLEKFDYLNNTYKFNDNNNNNELTIELSRHNAIFNEEIFELILLYCTSIHIIKIEKLSILLNVLLYLDYFSIVDIDCNRFSISNNNKLESLMYLLTNKEYHIFKQLCVNWRNDHNSTQFNKIIIDSEIKELYKYIHGNYFYDETMEKPILAAHSKTSSYICHEIDQSVMKVINSYIGYYYFHIGDIKLVDIIYDYILLYCLSNFKNIQKYIFMFY